MRLRLLAVVLLMLLAALAGVALVCGQSTLAVNNNRLQERSASIDPFQCAVEDAAAIPASPAQMPPLMPCCVSFPSANAPELPAITETYVADACVEIPGFRPRQFYRDESGFTCGDCQRLHLPDGRVFTASIDITHCGNGRLEITRDGQTTLDLLIYDCHCEAERYKVFRGGMLEYNFIYVPTTLYLHIFGEQQELEVPDHDGYDHDSAEDSEPCVQCRRMIDHLYRYDEELHAWLAVRCVGQINSLLREREMDPLENLNCATFPEWVH